MRLPSLRRPSPSMAVSIMALVVASTGTSYAAGLIGSDDIKNNSIQSNDVKDGTAQGPRHQGRLDRVQQDPQRLAQVASDFKDGVLPPARSDPPVPPVSVAGPSSTPPARSSPSPVASP